MGNWSNKHVSYAHQAPPNKPLPEIIFDEVSKRGPGFSVDANSISFLETPPEFLNTILAGINNAKHKIILSSLYLGTGNAEKQIIKALHQKLQTEPNIRVTILLDYLRGTRGGTTGSSVSMLQPLVREHGQNIDVSFYHTPQLRGFWKRVLPERMNEVVGVQHMKIYAFDNDLLLSGANLSDWYFIDRQDRYVLIKGQEKVTNYFEQLVRAMNSVSYMLTRNGELILPGKSGVPTDQVDSSTEYTPFDPLTETSNFVQYSRNRLKTFIEPNGNTRSETGDTWIFPVIQMGPLGIRHDQYILDDIFNVASSTRSHLSLSAAYFNFTSKLIQTILHRSQNKMDILTACPKANGFFTAKGISGYIPNAYDALEQSFFKQIVARNLEQNVRIFEYNRSKWTFHAKGLWLHDKDGLPICTLIGSSNFGQRSEDRDTEAQIMILTQDEKLREKMEQERSRLFLTSQQASSNVFAQPDRKVNVVVRLIVKWFKNYL